MKPRPVIDTKNILSKLLRIPSTKAGLPPGSVVHVGKQKVKKSILEVMDYSGQSLAEKTLKNVEESYPYYNTKTTTWLNIIGIHEVDNITKLGTHFNLHPLIQEDIANTGQRPSFEESATELFITLKMLMFDEENRVNAENVSIVIGKQHLLSFQEREGDVFEGVRKRIRDKRKIIQKGTDYLAYALVDAIVDHYFVVLEKLGEQIEDVDDELNDDPTQDTFLKINKLKRELIFVRRQIWPLREVLNQFKRVESALVKKETIVFINDVYNHTIQLIDTLESLRDVVSGMTDVYLSSVSNKMNEIMKVLTIFAAIFIPLTFIAGIYGMNFVNMPELQSQYGYGIIWGVFIITGFGMFAFFRKKGWV